MDLEAKQETFTSSSEESGDAGIKIGAVFSLATECNELPKIESEGPTKSLNACTIETPETVLSAKNEVSDEKGTIKPTARNFLGCVNDGKENESKPKEKKKTCIKEDKMAGSSYAEEAVGKQKSKKNKSDLKDHIPIKQETSPSTHKYVSVPVSFQPCFVVVYDVMKQKAMKEELERLRVKDERRRKIKKRKQLIEQRLEEKSKNRQRPLRGDKGAVISPFIEDPEDIMKKKIDPNAVAVKIRRKKKSFGDTPTRRSLRHSDVAMNTESLESHDVQEESTKDPDNDISPEFSRPSRKRKANTMFSGSSYVVDSRGLESLWQGSDEKVTKKTRYQSVYRLGYYRPQTARSNSKLYQKRREDLPFTTVTLNKDQVSELSEIPPKQKPSPDQTEAWDVSGIPLYMKKTMYMKETSRGSFKLVPAPRLKRTDKPESEKMKSKINRKKTQEKQHSVLSTGKQKFKSTIGHVKKIKSVTSTGSEPQQRIPCSLVGRWRKPNNRYSSGFVTKFEGNWKHLVKQENQKESEERSEGTDIKREPDCPSPSTDTASESSSPSPTSQTVGQKPTHSAEVSNTDIPIGMQRLKSILPKQEPKSSDYPAIENPNCVPDNPKVSVAMRTNTLSSGALTSDPAVSPKETTSLFSGSYPTNFANTISLLAKEENTKKFLQLRIGDKLVLIPSYGGNVATPKAYVINTFPPPQGDQNAASKVTSGTTSNLNIPGSFPTLSTQLSNSSSATESGNPLSLTLDNPQSMTPLSNIPSTVQIGNPQSTTQISDQPSALQIGNHPSISQLSNLPFTLNIGSPPSMTPLSNSASTVQIGNPPSIAQISNPASTLQIGNPPSLSQLGNLPITVQIGNPPSMTQLINPAVKTGKTSSSFEIGNMPSTAQKTYPQFVSTLNNNTPSTASVGDLSSTGHTGNLVNNLLALTQLGTGNQASTSQLINQPSSTPASISACATSVSNLPSTAKIVFKLSSDKTSMPSTVTTSKVPPLNMPGTKDAGFPSPPVLSPPLLSPQLPVTSNIITQSEPPSLSPMLNSISKTTSGININVPSQSASESPLAASSQLIQLASNVHSYVTPNTNTQPIVCLPQRPVTQPVTAANTVGMQSNQFLIPFMNLPTATGSLSSVIENTQANTKHTTPEPSSTSHLNQCSTKDDFSVVFSPKPSVVNEYNLLGGNSILPLETKIKIDVRNKPQPDSSIPVCSQTAQTDIGVEPKTVLPRENSCSPVLQAARNVLKTCLFQPPSTTVGGGKDDTLTTDKTPSDPVDEIKKEPTDSDETESDLETYYITTNCSDDEDNKKDNQDKVVEKIVVSGRNSNTLNTSETDSNTCTINDQSSSTDNGGNHDNEASNKAPQKVSIKTEQMIEDDNLQEINQDYRDEITESGDSMKDTDYETSTKKSKRIPAELRHIPSVGTHVPANETQAEERIRKLREKLLAEQTVLDNARKRLQALKEISSDF